MAKKRLLADDYLSNLMANMTPPPVIPSPLVHGPLINQLLKNQHKNEMKTIEVTTIDITPIKEEIASIAIKFMGKKGKLIQEKIDNANSLREINTSLKDIEKFAYLFLKSKIADQMLEEMNWTINQSIQA